MLEVLYCKAIAATLCNSNAQEISKVIVYVLHKVEVALNLRL